MRTASLMLVMTLAACSKAKQQPAAEQSHGMTMDSGAMGPMPGMRGSGMMTTMPAHLDSMTRMSPAQMSARMAQHERMMSEMLDQMGGDMRQMKMAETPEWTALTDSVRQDLAELPGLQGKPLAERMRAHAGRVQRLMTVHQQMMSGMH